MVDLTPIGLAVYMLVVTGIVAAVELYTGERISESISERTFIALLVGGFVVSVPVALAVFAYVNSVVG